MYGFILGEISGLTENVPVINLALNNGTATTEYTLTYSNIGAGYAWTDNPDTRNIILGEINNNFMLIVSSLTSEDVGDEYTINLSLPEEPTQSFSDAVHMVLGEEVLWEGDVTDTPQPIPFPSPVTTWTAFSATIDGKKATLYADYDAHTSQWLYTYSVGEDAIIIISYDENQSINTIVSDISGVTNHVKISKITDNTIRIPSYIDEGDGIVIEGGSADDLLTASEDGYMLYLWCEDYSLTTPITMSYINNAIRFYAYVHDGTNQMTWTIDQNGVIKGSFGGIN